MCTTLSSLANKKHLTDQRVFELTSNRTHSARTVFVGSVVLHIRFELIDNGLMIETATRADGTPVSTIVFHKVSQD
jgi:hypothetical protein